MKKSSLLAVFGVAMVFTACNDSEFEGYTKAENGLHYKFFNHDEAATKVQEGDGVVISYVIMNQKNDSVIIDSKNASRDGSGYVNFPKVTSSFKGSFEDGMMMMAKGDSAEFVVSADSFFLKSMRANELPKGFSPGQHLKAVFKIKEITPKAEMEAMQKKEMEQQQAMQMQQEAMAKELQPKEQPAIEKYLADNKIKVKPTASGLYYIETKKGSGASPKATDVVKVHYTGMLLDGTIFDSTKQRGEPADLPLSQMIPGWIEGIQLMKKGGKANMVIPSSLGWGANGAGDKIPPYSAVVFEVELLDFNPAPEQGAMPPMPGR